MRAARLTGWRAPLEIGEVPEPACPRDGVVVEVLACGICRSDWHVWSGADPVDLPHIPGHEYCGVVVEAGPRCAAGAWATG
jgi:D-arabinose 1-dehydrogenase-like Zn-dependent alcohol dehydrogenase